VQRVRQEPVAVAPTNAGRVDFQGVDAVDQDAAPWVRAAMTTFRSSKVP
jgi:hypothetical protein